MAVRMGETAKRASAKIDDKRAIREAQLAYVQTALDRTKRSPTDLARAIGAHPSTLTRFLTPDYSGTLHALTLQRIGEVAGIEAPGKMLAAPELPRGLREEGAPWTQGPQNSNSRAAAFLGSDPNRFAFTLATDALALAGVRPGDFLVFDRATNPRPGDVVCAQIEQNGGAVTVFRLFQPPNLIAAAVDPLAYRPEPVDGERVRIVAPMVDLLRMRAA